MHQREPQSLPCASELPCWELTEMPTGEVKRFTQVKQQTPQQRWDPQIKCQPWSPKPGRLLPP